MTKTDDFDTIVPQVNTTEMESVGTRRRPQVSIAEVQSTGQLPEGYELKFSNRGIPHLVSTDSTQEDDDAANEHATDKLSLFISQDEIERRYGIGIRLYFNFLKFIMITNSILSVFTIIHWGVYLGKEKNHSGFYLGDFFVSAYPYSMRKLWIAMNIISIVSWFLFGPVYFFYVKKVLARSGLKDHDNPFLFSGNGLDLIKDNRHVTSGQRFSRRLLSYFLFLILVILTGGINIAVQYAALKSKSINNAAATFARTVGVTLVVSVINFLSQFMGIFLTKLEKHRTWSQHRQHEGIKLLSFKIINVLCFYLGAWIVKSIDDDVTYRCYMEDTGIKFLTLLITDVFVMNSIELFVPVIRRKIISRIRRLRNTGGDDAAKPEFDVAEEYLELFYRQFVIFIGMSVFPMITVFGLITNIIEFPIDKYRLMRMCQKPQRLDLSMKTFLLFWMIIIAAVALLCFPQGPIWVMALKRNNSLDGYGCCNILNGPAPANATQCQYYFEDQADFFKSN